MELCIDHSAIDTQERIINQKKIKQNHQVERISRYLKEVCFCSNLTLTLFLFNKNVKEPEEKVLECSMTLFTGIKFLIIGLTRMWCENRSNALFQRLFFRQQYFFKRTPSLKKHTREKKNQKHISASLEFVLIFTHSPPRYFRRRRGKE